jgi:hypothetical protein
VSRLSRLGLAARYAVELPRFLRTPVTAGAARKQIAAALERRERSFLEILERGVFGHAQSPYRRLLDVAGIEFGDVEALVRRDGVEGALERLYDAGVRVTLSEFKGRRPIVRPGLELHVTGASFRNPLASAHFEKLTGGSRSVGRPVSTDLALLAYEAGHHRLFLDALGLGGRPMAIWGARASSTARVALRHVKAGESVDRWLVKMPLPRSEHRLIAERLIRRSATVSRRLGLAGLATPEHVPAAATATVARWLAAERAAGRPALLETTPSTAVRTCLAASEQGLDISETWFRLAGEPFTEGKAAVIHATGSYGSCHYSMAEIGRIGMACTAPAAVDDVHLLVDKVALIRRLHDGHGAPAMPSFHITTLLASCPSLMLNVEVDDYGVLETRSCGCPFGELGLTLHLHGIRSYEKLTVDGVNFLGSDLIVLVDEVLPARFGGSPTDYQLIEEEVDGVTRLGILVSPRIGELDEAAVLDVVTGVLRANSANRGMVDVWRDAGTFRVVRREAYETSGAKLLPLHLVQG